MVWSWYILRSMVVSEFNLIYLIRLYEIYLKLMRRRSYIKNAMAELRDDSAQKRNSSIVLVNIDLTR